MLTSAVADSGITPSNRLRVWVTIRRVLSMPGRAAAGPLAVAHDRGGIAHRFLRQVGQLADDAPHSGLCFVILLRAAQLQLPGDRASPPTSGTSPVPHPVRDAPPAAWIRFTLLTICPTD